MRSWRRQTAMQGIRVIPVLLLSMSPACSSESESQGSVVQLAKLDLRPTAPLERDFVGLLAKDSVARKRAYDAIAARWSHYRPTLVERVDARDVRRRVATAYLFSRLGGPSDLPLLRSYFEKRPFELHQFAVRGLVRLGDVEGLKRIVARAAADDFDDLALALPALFELDAQAGARTAIRLISHSRWATRRVAARCLRHCAGEEAMAALRQALQDPVWCVLLDACESAGALGFTGLRDSVKPLLDHQDWQIRAAAVRALVQIGGVDAADTAGAVALGDADKNVRIAAVASLGQLEETIFLPWFRQVLQRAGENEKVHRAVLRILLTRGTPNALRLVELSTDQSPRLRRFVELQTPAAKRGTEESR